MSGGHGRHSAPVRRPPLRSSQRISSDGAGSASTPSSYGASTFAGPVRTGHPTPLQGGRRASNSNSTGDGSEQPSKKVKVEEIDLTQDSSSSESDEEDEDEEVEVIDDDDEDMEEAEEREQSREGRQSEEDRESEEGDDEADEEEDLEDEDYTDIPARKSRHKSRHTSSTTPARGSRDPRTATAPTPRRAPTSVEGSQRRSSQRVSQDGSHPQAPVKQRRGQSAGRSAPAVPRHRRSRSRERTPPRPRHLGPTHSWSASPEPREHRTESPPPKRHHHKQQYEEGEQAQYYRSHPEEADDVYETQGTSSRESEPVPQERSGPSPHPAPASNAPSLPQQLLELQRAKQTLRRQYDRMDMQHAQKQNQLRSDLEAMTVAHDKQASKSVAETKQRKAAEAELVSVQSELSRAKMTESALRALVQGLRQQLQEQQEEQEDSQDEPQQQQQAHEAQQQRQQANHQRQARAADQQAAAARAHAAAQAASRQASAAAAAAAAHAAANAAANAAAQAAGAQFAQQQRANQAWQKAQLEHNERMRQHQAALNAAAAAAAAANAAAYGARGPQWSGPHFFPGGPSQQPFHPQHGYYNPNGPQPAASRPAPAAPTATLPQHSAAAVFATSIPPVLDTNTRIPVLRQYLTQAGAADAMSRINEKEELLAFALTKSNAWEIRRLVACSTVAVDPGFSSTAQAQAFAYAAALRVPAGIRADSAPGQAILQAAYKDLRIRVHPDKNPGDHATATAAFQFLQQANAALSR